MCFVFIGFFTPKSEDVKISRQGWSPEGMSGVLLRAFWRISGRPFKSAARGIFWEVRFGSGSSQEGGLGTSDSQCQGKSETRE